MREIPLSRGLVALVDDEDFERLSKFKWYASPAYAVRNGKDADGKAMQIRMHREILNAKPDQEVDHVNRNGFDNRRENLRLCSHAENVRNRSSYKNNSSGFKGVSFHKGTGKWQARIRIDERLQHLGVHATAEEAARAYDAAAIEIHGKFASLNFPA